MSSGTSILYQFFSLSLNLSIYHTIPTLKKNASENTVEKEENAGNQHFLLFPQCFLVYHKEKMSFKQCLIFGLQMLSIWSCPKICHFGKGLIVYYSHSHFTITS